MTGGALLPSLLGTQHLQGVIRSPSTHLSAAAPASAPVSNSARRLADQARLRTESACPLSPPGALLPRPARAPPPPAPRGVLRGVPPTQPAPLPLRSGPRSCPRLTPPPGPLPPTLPTPGALRTVRGSHPPPRLWPLPTGALPCEPTRSETQNMLTWGLLGGAGRRSQPRRPLTRPSTPRLRRPTTAPG